MSENISSNIHGIVTTPRKRDDFDYLALETAERTGLPFVPRDEKSLVKLREEYSTKIICVESPDGPYLGTAEGKLFFHEGTSVIRTDRVFSAQKRSSLIRALDVCPDDNILDCTLGLGIDAMVAAVHLDKGSITGLEAGLLLSDIVSRGLRDYDFSRERIAEGAKKIKVLHADYRDFLRKCGDGQYDTVYFDPMFDHTVEKSDKIKRLREVAVMDPLTVEDVQEACRVARKRVVVKVRRGIFGEVEFGEKIESGRSILYGIIRV